MKIPDRKIGESGESGSCEALSGYCCGVSFPNTYSDLPP